MSGADDLPGCPSPFTEGARIMLAGEVPEGWESRSCAFDDFATDHAWSSDAIVEARPVPVPPVVVEIPREDAKAFAEAFAILGPFSHAGRLVKLIEAAL